MKFAALVTRTITIPGDQRSRDAPGHGYPEHDVTSIEIVEFKDKVSMEKWVAHQNDAWSKPDFRLIQYEELAFETAVVVKIKETLR